MSWWLTVDETVQHLIEEELDEDGSVREKVASALAEEPAALAWYVRGGLAIVAWLAAIVLVASCAPFATISSAILVVVGMSVTIAATIVRWVRPASTAVFVDAATFAAVIAGRALLAGGLVGVLNVPSTIFGDLTLLFLVFLVIELFVLFAYPDRIHRGLSTMIACALAIACLSDYQPAVDALLGIFPAAAAVLIMVRHTVAFTRLRNLIEPLSVALAMVGMISMGRFWSGWAEESWVQVVGGATAVLTLVVVGFTLFRVRAAWHGWIVGLVGGALLVGLGIGLPGLSVALAFVLISLLVRDITLLVASLAALVGFGAWAYTFVELPTLLKGGALAGSGLLLLAMRGYMLWQAPKTGAEVA